MTLDEAKLLSDSDLLKFSDQADRNKLEAEVLLFILKKSIELRNKSLDVQSMTNEELIDFINRTDLKKLEPEVLSALWTKSIEARDIEKSNVQKKIEELGLKNHLNQLREVVKKCTVTVSGKRSSSSAKTSPERNQELKRLYTHPMYRDK